MYLHMNIYSPIRIFFDQLNVSGYFFFRMGKLPYSNFISLNFLSLLSYLCVIVTIRCDRNHRTYSTIHNNYTDTQLRYNIIIYNNV